MEKIVQKIVAQLSTELTTYLPGSLFRNKNFMLDEITQRNASKSSHVFNMKMQARVFCVGKST